MFLIFIYIFSSTYKTLGGGFKYRLFSSLTWGRSPIWLIFFRWVETTNQKHHCFGKKHLYLLFCWSSTHRSTDRDCAAQRLLMDQLMVGVFWKNGPLVFGEKNRWPQKRRVFLGGGFIFFHPYLGKMNPTWRAYFSNGLKPPTSQGFLILPIGSMGLIYGKPRFVVDLYGKPTPPLTYHPQKYGLVKGFWTIVFSW